MRTEILNRCHQTQCHSGPDPESYNGILNQVQDDGIRAQSGRTMVEMLGVLAIMGVIMYGAITGIGFGVDMYKVTTAYNDVEELAQSVIDMWSWKRSYGNDDDNLGYTLCAQNSAPVDCSEGKAPLGPWSNEIAVTSRGQTFTISMTLPSKFICNRLKSLDYHNVCVVKHAPANAHCSTDCENAHSLCFVQSETEQFICNN